MELFETIDELQQYAPGVDSSLTLDELNAVFLGSKSAITNIITIQVWNAIKSNQTLLPTLKMAMANSAIFSNLIFYNISKNGNDGKLYKYQYNELQELYLNNYHNAMSSLLSDLDGSDITEWKETPCYKDREALIVKNCNDFESLYNIGGSSYFFYMLLQQMKEVQDSFIFTRIKKSEYEALTDDEKKTAKRAVIYGSMAKAFKIFDFNHFPAPLRRYITAEFSTVVPANQQRDILYNEHQSQFESYLSQLEFIIRSKTTVDSFTANKDSNNKFFLMS